MTMSGTCTCGCFLWYESVELELSRATREGRKTYKEFKRYIDESRPDGLLVCRECGKRYSEREFMELTDCVGYDTHAGCTRDPELAYQQAIARGFEVRYKAEADAVYKRDHALVVCAGLIIIVLCLLGSGLVL